MSAVLTPGHLCSCSHGSNDNDLHEWHFWLELLEATCLPSDFLEQCVQIIVRLSELKLHSSFICIPQDLLLDGFECRLINIRSLHHRITLIRHSIKICRSSTAEFDWNSPESWQPDTGNSERAARLLLSSSFSTLGSWKLHAATSNMVKPILCIIWTYESELSTPRSSLVMHGDKRPQNQSQTCIVEQECAARFLSLQLVVWYAGKTRQDRLDCTMRLLRPKILSSFQVYFWCSV